MLRYDALRAVAIIGPVTGTLFVGVVSTTFLDIDAGAVLIFLLVLPVLQLVGSFMGYVAGVERPAETHADCSEALCLHKRQINGRHRRRVLA